MGRIATVSNERQKDDQSVRSRLAALGFKDETVPGRGTGIIGGIRKPSRIRDVTDELLEKGIGGIIITNASKKQD